VSGFGRDDVFVEGVRLGTATADSSTLLGMTTEWATTTANATATTDSSAALQNDNKRAGNGKFQQQK
jgi:hypothetical protein